MTFLLESKKGSRACLALSWNNETENVSINRFMDIVGKTLKFAEILILSFDTIERMAYN